MSVPQPALDPPELLARIIGYRSDGTFAVTSPEMVAASAPFAAALFTAASAAEQAAANAEAFAEIAVGAVSNDRLMFLTTAPLAGLALDATKIVEVIADPAGGNGMYVVQAGAWTRVSTATTPALLFALTAEQAARRALVDGEWRDPLMSEVWYDRTTGRKAGGIRRDGTLLAIAVALAEDLLLSSMRAPGMAELWIDRASGRRAGGIRRDGTLETVALDVSHVLFESVIRVPGFAEVWYDLTSGCLAGGITNAGGIKAVSLDLGRQLSLETLRLPGWAEVIFSFETGMIAGGMRADGTRVGLGIGAGTAEPGTPAAPAVTGRGAITWQYGHVAALTQSWGGGTGSGTPITTEPQAGVLMFNGGIRPFENGVASPMSSLVPAFEQQRPDSSRAETPWSAFAAAFKAAAIEDGHAEDMADHHLILSVVSPGGSTLDQISPGSDDWNNWRATVTNAYNLSVAAGRVYRLLGVPIMIGKGDYDMIRARSATEQPDRTEYRDKILALCAAINAHVRTLDPLHPDVPVYWYQSLAHVHNGAGRFPEPTIDWAAADAEALDPRIVVLAPMYPYAADDDAIHYTGPAYREMGASGGAAAWHWLVKADDTGGVPVEPAAMVRQGRTVVVWYQERLAPLAFDAEIIVDPGNFGLSIVDPTGAEIALAEPPAIIGGNGIRFVSPTVIPAGCRYRVGKDDVLGGGIGALTGYRSCLRRSWELPLGGDFAGVVARAWAPSVDLPIP